MTRKNFKLIAEVLNKTREELWPLGSKTIDRVAEEFADALAKTNPRFDHDKFLAACGFSQC